LQAHCIHDVPHNARVEKLADSTKVTAPDGTVSLLPLCTPLANPQNPVIRRNRPVASKGVGPRAAVGGPLPPDYDGWLQYAATNITDTFDAMTNLMSVPDVPKQLPQILYLFPGLQNIDWIPKVDPEPSVFNPFDIIQPVLQYPGAAEGQWGVRSWYVHNSHTIAHS
jgi:hypothetical protein